MSTTTDKLALFKYDPSTDGAQTFNIKKALNDNWDKLDDAVKEILITLANKAPGGFGWGDTVTAIFAADTNTYEEYCAIVDVALSGMQNNTAKLVWARCIPPFYTQADNTLAVLYKINDTDASLTGIGVSSSLSQGGLWRMLKTGGSWIDPEWEIPPMLLGVEYRTTERFEGKPVYVRLHDFGALPNNTFKEDSSPAGWSIDKAICAHGTTNGGLTIPTQNYAGQITTGRHISMYFSPSELVVATDADRTDVSAKILLKYTKTTD